MLARFFVTHRLPVLEFGNRQLSWIVRACRTVAVTESEDPNFRIVSCQNRSISVPPLQEHLA
jgi:hypothetical protein